MINDLLHKLLLAFMSSCPLIWFDGPRIRDKVVLWCVHVHLGTYVFGMIYSDMVLSL